MPYLILHKSPRCWAVINKETGRVHAKCTTETKAKAQMRLLDQIEKGTEKNISMDNKKKMNPWINYVKKVAVEKGISYREALKIASKTYKKKTMKGKGMGEDMDMMEEEDMMEGEQMKGGKLKKKTKRTKSRTRECRALCDVSMCIPDPSDPNCKKYL